jgi:tRNA/tmRNA/rRNA uracil-C5-methylase (TrmA/RlmC/RlmD family)
MRDLKKEYSQHLLEKTNAMQSLLAELGSSCPCQSIIPSPVENGYRNRAKFKIFGRTEHFEIKGTDPLLGEVPFEESLWILPKWGRMIAGRAGDCLGNDPLGCRVDGFELQLSHGRREAHLTLSVKADTAGDFDRLVLMMQEEIVGLVGVAIPSKKIEVGERFLRHRLLGMDILAHYAAFFQSNLYLTPDLVETVCSFFEGSRFRRIDDLYCGVGLFSLFFGNHAREILGVDSSQRAVESARENAKRMGLKHTRFICTSVDSFVEDQLKKKRITGNDLVLLNPPRSGVPSPVIEAVSSIGVETVGLVSCSLETHVRDLCGWQKAGYSLESMTAFDMFPFTDFIETATLLKRKK